MKKIILVLLLATFAHAQGTQVWQQTTYDDFSKGVSHGVSISSDGTLTPAPSLQTVFESPSAYIWGVAIDKDRTTFIAAGQPARVYRVAPDGKATIVLLSESLQVQAVALAPDGTLYAATSPDGKIYKITHGTPDNGSVKDGTVPIDKDYAASMFFDPQRKYIWALATDKDGNVFAATGDQGEIFKINGKGQGSVWFKSDDAHIRSLLFAPDGTVYAGTDGSGLIYRITAGSDGKGNGFVLYSANKKEVTALALDDSGTLYAAAIGDKKPSSQSSTFSFPQQQQFGAPGGQPANTSVLPPNVAFTQTGGSEVYRIPQNGPPEKMWSSRDELVYSLSAEHGNRVTAATGNKGRLLALSGANNFREIVRASALQLTSVNGHIREKATYLASSNPGKLMKLGPGDDAAESFESDVLDAHVFTHWGRAEIFGKGLYHLWTRSGNVENPERNWSPWAEVDTAKGSRISSPPSRFLQWKIVFVTPDMVRSGAESGYRVDSVRINYLTQNVAPIVEDVVVQTNARVNAVNFTRQPETANINFPPAPGTPPPPQAPKFEQPLSAVKERGSVTARWAAHDDNDDQLVFKIYYRGIEETRWKMLKDGITEKYYSFDASLLPDGAYTLRIVASDAPSHTPGEELTDARDSTMFEIDTTPPQIESLNAKSDSKDPARLRVTFTARDAFSTIHRAEVSVDAGDWQLVEPIDKISDSRSAAYDFAVPIPATSVQPPALPNDAPGGNNMGEHTVTVRVYDRFDNMAAVKVIVK